MILVVIGTSREGNFSSKVADFLTPFIEDQGFSIKVVRPEDFGMTKTGDEEGKGKWQSLVKEAKGFIIISPEYNHGYPGELKILLDAAYDEYAGKPATVVGVSSGRLGGARMMASLKEVLNELGLIVGRKQVYVGPVRDLDESDFKEKYEKAISGMLGELTSSLQD